MKQQKPLQYVCALVSRKEENIGVLLILLGNVIWAFYPAIARLGAQIAFPMFFVAVTTLIASLIALAVTLLKGKFHEVVHKNMLFEYLMITLFIMIIPSLLVFLGSRGNSSGVDITFLLMSELIFTMIVTPFFGEKTTRIKLLGS